MPRIARRRGAWAALALVLAVVVAGPPPSQAGTPPLKPIIRKTVTEKLGDRRFRLPYSVYLVPMADTTRMRLRLVGDLSGLQSVLPDYLAAETSRHNKKCGDRFNASKITVEPAPPSLRISGRARYERWACAKLRYPEFHGFSVKMREKLAITRLLAQPGRITIVLTPVVTKGTLGVTTTSADVKLYGPGGDIVRGLGLGDDIAKAVRDSINKNLGGDAARMKMPEEIRKLGVRFVAARFLNLSARKPRLGFEVTAEVKATPEFFSTLYRKYLATP